MLNLAMGYIRIIAYMNTYKLKETIADTYQETEKLYETLLEKAEKEAEELSEKEKKTILKVIEYLRHPKIQVPSSDNDKTRKRNRLHIHITCYLTYCFSY